MNNTHAFFKYIQIDKRALKQGLCGAEGGFTSSHRFTENRKQITCHVCIKLYKDFKALEYKIKNEGATPIPLSAFVEQNKKGER